MQFLVSLAFSLLFSFSTFAGGPEQSPAPQPQQPDVQKRCYEFPAELDGGFCVSLPKVYQGDVLYHFHGLGGSEQNWGNKAHYSSQLAEYWREHGVSEPLAISISFGPVWLLAEKNESTVSGLFEVLTQSLIPYIESQLGLPVHRRFLVGESMGGFNAIQMGMKTDLFEKVAVLCASMATLSPWATDAETTGFIENSRAWPYFAKDEADRNAVYTRIAKLKQLARAFFPTPEDWANANPLSLVLQTREEKIRTSFYVSAGLIDPYLLYEGNLSFQNSLRSVARSVEWRPLYAGHCAADIPTLADFLAP